MRNFFGTSMNDQKWSSHRQKNLIRSILIILILGNIEIYHNSKWGNICDDEWDHRDGHVICQQLGFAGVKRITHSSYYGVATRK